MTFQIKDTYLNSKQLANLKLGLHIPSKKKWFQFYELDSERFWLEYQNHFSFYINKNLRQVDIFNLKKKAIPGLVHYIQTQLKSFLLCLDNQESLHGTALQKGKKCYVFLGDSGQGKSTLAAYLMTEGWNLLVDDLIQFTPDLSRIIIPKYTYLKLFPSIAKKFPPDGKNIGSLNSKTSKQIWEIKTNKIQIKPSAFFLIDHRKTDLLTRRLYGVDAFSALQSSTFNITFWKKSRFANSLIQFSNLAKKYPVYELNYPKKISSLSKVKKLLDHFELDSPGFDSIPT